ncbi:MAG: NAD-binding protein [Propionibacteriaceae bacterium]|nr:NAD-binding protein [Propionibacteriaceae bacterium]
MGNPLLLLSTRERVRRQVLRRRQVAVPTEVPGTDAIFLVLRRMRAPLIVLIVIFAISVIGLSLMPGVDGDGNPHRLTMFDAFYVISYTATTIGFGEIPYPFTYPQRMWVTFSIYLSVIGWAYALSALFALVQDRGFREAITVQRLRRRVRSISEPFLIVAGYGQTGRAVSRVLDDHGRRFVVVDHNQTKVDNLAIDQHSEDVPGIQGDVHNPALLGLAGLGHPLCEGVLALTNDACNLAIAMNVHMLRPDLPVIARCDNRRIAQRMTDFGPTAVINPYDRYGHYLALALKKPATFQLATWLMDPVDSPMLERLESLTDGPWVVVGDGKFSQEVARDLQAIGLDVTISDPADGNPDVTGKVGMVAGAESDVENLALAAHARLENPDIYLAVRHRAGVRGRLAVRAERARRPRGPRPHPFAGLLGVHRPCPECRGRLVRGCPGPVPGPGRWGYAHEHRVRHRRRGRAGSDALAGGRQAAHDRAADRRSRGLAHPAAHARRLSHP